MKANVNNPFQEIGFFLEVTKDGSPTLRLTEDIRSGESMHHSGGAAAETNYIYKSVIQKAMVLHQLKRPKAEFKTLVVGLGLGYIEISWAQVLLQQRFAFSNNLSLESFEIVSGLRNCFSNWFENKEELKIYNQITEKLDSSSCVAEVKKILGVAFANGRGLYADILDYKGSQKWNMICYDAFSQQTSGPLWNETFLNQFFKNHAAVDCVFTTYACTGILKKVLAENGFYFIKRPGFQGKRDSTIALRGLFMEDLSIFQTF
ncbi:MAG: hypothetical protein H7328_08585 [Bdellovibrio sp.]|nr:hypothetical protein [Bdellovibrio sp.]